MFGKKKKVTVFNMEGFLAVPEGTKGNVVVVRDATDAIFVIDSIKGHGMKVDESAKLIPNGKDFPLGICFIPTSKKVTWAKLSLFQKSRFHYAQYSVGDMLTDVVPVKVNIFTKFWSWLGMVID